MSRCLRCIVRGRVQGVFFRASTQKKALRLGLTGHARNLSDGTVQTLICGETDAIEALQKWLWQGPPQAHVSDVQCEELTLLDVDRPEGFQTR